MKGRVAISILLCLAILIGLFVISTNKDNLIGKWSVDGVDILEFKRNGKGKFEFVDTKNIQGSEYGVLQTINFEWDANMGLLDMYTEVLGEEIKFADDVLYFVIGDTLITFYDGEFGVVFRD